MIRIVAALWLALCGGANAQLAGGLQFPGPGLPVVAGASYAYVNSATSSAAGNSLTTSPALGASANCKIIISVAIQSGGTPSTISTLTVGATGLTADSTQTQASNVTAVYSGDLVGTCNGSPTITLTTSGPTFRTRTIYIWTVTGLTTGFVNAGGFTRTASTNTPASPTINVAAGDFMFSAKRGISNFSCAGATQAPTNSRTNGTDTISGADDWAIASSNAAFAITCTGPTDGAVAVATYR